MQFVTSWTPTYDQNTTQNDEQEVVYKKFKVSSKGTFIDDRGLLTIAFGRTIEPIPVIITAENDENDEENQKMRRLQKVAVEDIFKIEV